MRASTGRWLLLGTAVAQAASPAVVSALGGFSGDDEQTEAALVPPGPFFGVWGVVTAGCLAVAVRGLPAARAGRAPWPALAVPLSATQVGFVAWLAAASTPMPVRVLTLPVFVAMVGGLAVALRAVRDAERRGELTGVDRALVAGTLGLYAGWSTAATWVNAVTLSSATRADDALGTAVQCAAVAGASACAAVGARWLRGSAAQVTFAAGSGWALTGVLVSAARAPLPVLAVTAGAGLAAVAAVAVRSRGALRRPRRA